MIHVRGNNLYPAAIEAIVRRFPQVAEYRIVVDHTGPLADLRIEVEPVAATAATLPRPLAGRSATNFSSASRSSPSRPYTTPVRDEGPTARSSTMIHRTRAAEARRDSRSEPQHGAPHACQPSRRAAHCSASLFSSRFAHFLQGKIGRLDSLARPRAERAFRARRTCRATSTRR